MQVIELVRPFTSGGKPSGGGGDLLWSILNKKFFKVAHFLSTSQMFGHVLRTLGKKVVTYTGWFIKFCVFHQPKNVRYLNFTGTTIFGGTLLYNFGELLTDRLNSHRTVRPIVVSYKLKVFLDTLVKVCTFRLT